MGGGDRYSSRKKGGSGIIYFILAVAFVLFMIKWGLPVLVNLLAGPDGSKGSVNQNDDVVPPQMPTLSALPEATNSASVSVEGYTEADAEITVWRNEELAETTKSDGRGLFLSGIRLAEGENRIQVKARDKAGNESRSLVKKIIFDKKGIDLAIEAPTEGAEIFGKNNQNVVVSGKVSKPNASVSVNGGYARVDSEGKYSQTIRLNEGENQITVQAVDKAGNAVEKTIKVKLTL